MSIIIRELPRQEGDIQFKAPKARRSYIVAGTLVKTDAQIAVVGYSPAYEDSIDDADNHIRLWRNKISIREKGGGVWESDVDYDYTPDQLDLNFNIGVQQAKMLQPLERIAIYDCNNAAVYTSPEPIPGNSTLPDWFGPIGIDGDKVNGVEIDIAKVEFVLTKRLNFADLSGTYAKQVADLTPSVNDATFTFFFKSQQFVFPRGSVLFRGAPLNVNSDSQLEMRYNFAYSKPLVANPAEWDQATTYAAGNQVEFHGDIYTSTVNGNLNLEPDTNPGSWTSNGPAAGEFQMGSSAPVVAEGWWYKWPYFVPGVANGAAQPVPRAIVVDRVYDYGNLNLLGL